MLLPHHGSAINLSLKDTNNSQIPQTYTAAAAEWQSICKNLFSLIFQAKLHAKLTCPFPQSSTWLFCIPWITEAHKHLVNSQNYLHWACTHRQGYMQAHPTGYKITTEATKERWIKLKGHCREPQKSLNYLRHSCNRASLPSSFFSWPAPYP